MPAAQDHSLPIKLQVSTDINQIKKVVVHRPDPGIEWVTPTNAESLLYDDIVFLPQMMQQHRTFVEVLQAILGSEAVIEFQDLLQELLKHQDIRQRLLGVVSDFEQVSADDQTFLEQLPPVSLAATLISGVVPGWGRPILPPLPNHIFTRDIGVVINQGFLTCMASKGPRMRESILTWFVSHYHPMFSTAKENQFIDLCEDEQALLAALKDPSIAIEGGDVMVIDKDNLFIGYSERTNQETIKKVASLLFEAKLTKRITLIDIPKLPTCIHLDTLFTQISSTEFVYYAPFLGMDKKVEITQYRGQVEEEVSYNSLHELLFEIQPEIKLIPCGNGLYPYEEREQYASGCNFVAVKDGVAISYARNLKTLEALKEYGYHVLSATELLAGIRQNEIQPAALKRTIITIPSSELCRAGGGPHCLTLPLIRK